jgi:molybdate transport system substrate-binding protein
MFSKTYHFSGARRMFGLSVLRNASRAIVLASALSAFVPVQAIAGELTVFAASSLTDVMQKIEPRFEAETGHELRFSLAGSSKLARQIQMGAPADVFISANTDWMDRLEADGMIAPETRRDILSNTLVLIAHDPVTRPLTIDSNLDLPALLGEGRLAMALVDAVPAGIYGKAALEHFGLWEGVAPLVAQASNVRAALAFVASGATPLGIVYETDAKAEDGVTIIARFPANSHPPILYPVAVMANSEGPAVADFLRFLDSQTAQSIFEQAGFTRPVD